MRANGFITAFAVVSIAMFGLCHLLFRIPLPDPPILVMEVISLIFVGYGVWYGKTHCPNPTPPR